jgi:hemerythrin superfamily protein
MTLVKQSTPKRRASPPRDATALLRADHKQVSDLFADYRKTRSAARKKTIVSRICAELRVHAQIEEEIFYPAVKQVLRDKVLVPEATVEHASLKALIAMIDDVDPIGEVFEAEVKVLSEYVKHHVKEEQDEMFPKVRASRLDLVELGNRMAARKAELQAEQG